VHHSAANVTDPSRWAVVVPAYNHAEDTITCLASLWQAEPRPGSVLLVDDASTENAIEVIAAWARKSDIPHRVVDPVTLTRAKQHAPWLTIVASNVNGGFVVSCNIGLRYMRDHTDSSHTLLLNNDTAVAPDYFGELALAVDRHPDVGLLTGSIYEWDRITVWYAGASFNPLRARAAHITGPINHNEARETGYVCGCTMLISRAVLEQVGLFDESFSPGYAEDLDYSLRARAAGFPVMYAPRAVCYHRVGTSLGRRAEHSPRILYSINRNLAFALRRNYRGWRLAGGIAYLAVTKPAKALLEVLRGRPRRARAVLSGTIRGIFSPSSSG
jgi:GT2 family glycosyltransferase